MNKKIVSILLCAVMLAISLFGCSPAKTESGDTTAPANNSSGQTSADTSAQPETITVTDHNGNVVVLPSEINRIVVADIYPVASILTVFLGSAEKIVGIHPVSMAAAKTGTLGELYPEILNADTGFMTGTDLNIEQLLNLEPDIVFYSADNPTLGETLISAGIAAVAISPSKWDYDIIETYDQWISLFSEIFPGKAGISEKVSGYSKEVYESIQKTVSGIKDADRKKILFLFNYDETTMVTSGKKFFGQFWCEATGGVNVAESLAGEKANAVINMEQVYEWDPDIIFITNFTKAMPEDIYNNAIGNDNWSSLTAVKNGDVYKLPVGTFRSYTPSTDTPVVLLWMAQKVYPELFEDVDIVKEVKDYYQELYNISLTDVQVDSMYNLTVNSSDRAK